MGVLDRLFKATGTRKSSIVNVQPGNPHKDNIGSLLKYAPTELNILVQRHYIEQQNTSNRDVSLSNIIAYVTPGHEKAVQLIHDAERIKAIAPEINSAEQILVSSIMSPNDLQEADPIYTIDDVPELQESMVSAICDYLKDRFTKNYQLGDKMTSWVKEALFRSGAAVILTLPEATLTRLIGRADVKGYEALCVYCSDESYRQIRDKPIYSRVSSTNGLEQFKLKSSKEQDIEREQFIASLINSAVNIYKSATETTAMSDIDQAGLESMTATIVTKIEEGDIIKISENPEVLRFGKAVRAYERNKLGKDFDTLWKESNKKNNVGTVTNIPQEEILDLTNYLIDNDKQDSLPFNIVIPSEAVIPVCEPGSKDRKLGYFILVDSHGRPIRAEQYISSGSGCSTSSRIANAYSSMFGSVPTPGGIQSPFASLSSRLGNSFNPSDDAMNQVFNHILDNMLRKKLQNVGLAEVDFGTYETIATCMFYRLLDKKETTLVFVPQSLITYIAFDFRENGCGKSLLEDINFILSLRVVLLVTNIMAMMRNSVAKREITVEFDEQETNQDQVIEQVRNLALQKSQINLSTNPAEVMRSINEQNISIKAVKHPNANGFDINSEYHTDNMPKADTELLDILNSWLTTAFGIPHSVFNQLDDAEYSKSVATSNLFFSERIRGYQKKLNEHVSNLIRLNLKYSPTMRDGITKIISDNVSGKLTDSPTVAVTDGGKDISGEKLDTKKTLEKIIQNIRVSLPAPNIAPNQAQYDLVQQFNNIATGIIDNLFPNELVQNDNDAQNGYTVIKSFMRSSLTKSFLQHLGLVEGLNIQELEDFMLEHREEMISAIRTFQNFNEDMKRDKEIRTTEISEDGTTSGSDDTSSGGTDFDSTDFNYS